MLFTDALAAARAVGSTFAEAAALHFLGNVAFNQCRDIESRTLHETALAMSRADGDDQGIATSLGSLAFCDVVEGEFTAAEERFAGAIDAYERAGMPDRSESLRATRVALIEKGLLIERLIHRTHGSAS